MASTRDPSAQTLPGASADPEASAAAPSRWDVSPRSLLHVSRRKHLASELLSVVVLLGAGVGLNVVPPVQRSFNVNDISIQNPMRPDTITEPMCFVLAGALPFVVMLIMGQKRAVRPAIGLWVSLGIALCVTGALKNLTGQLRPDFLARCDPQVPTDGSQPFCRGDPKVVNEGRRSFPSGHSSFSAAGLVYLAFYIVAYFRVFEYDWSAPHKAKALKLALAFIPATGAAAIALTRIPDNRHGWLDVIAGFALGTFIAYLCAILYVKGFRPSSAPAQYYMLPSPSGVSFNAEALNKPPNMVPMQWVATAPQSSQQAPFHGVLTPTPLPPQLHDNSGSSS